VAAAFLVIAESAHEGSWCAASGRSGLDQAGNLRQQKVTEPLDGRPKTITSGPVTDMRIRWPTPAARRAVRRPGQPAWSRLEAAAGWIGSAPVTQQATRSLIFIGVRPSAAPVLS
jgi:hypothetical protein